MLLFAILSSGVQAQGLGPLPVPLKGIQPPPVPGLVDGASPIVINKQKAIALGKALFWDTNVGSDGMACGSCHFQAGADRRIKNQLAPKGKSSVDALAIFDSFSADGSKGPNYTLKNSDFPFDKPNDPFGEIAVSGFLNNSDDVAGSAGSFSGKFITADLSVNPADYCDRSVDAIFHKNGTGTRRVTMRNAPTVINAVFNHRNFWDGRANNIFNGSSLWGERDAQAGVWVKNSDGSISKQKLNLINSSLASQAIAPALDTTEMSCASRTFPDLGRKVLLRRPLENQKVHWQDSVLGSYAFSTSAELKNGLKTFYIPLIRQSFDSRYWSSTQRGPFGAPLPLDENDVPVPYSQIEANFGMFFAIAIQLYESTLISDDSPFDRSQRDAAGNPVDLTSSQIRGMEVFRDAHCGMCHVGPVFTSAAVITNAELAKTNPLAFGNSSFKVSATTNVLDRARGLKGNGFVDTGFASTGVVSDDRDIGLGGVDSFGNPLSYAEQYLDFLTGNFARVIDPDVANIRPCDLTLPIARNQASANILFFTRKDGIKAQVQSTENCFNPSGAFLPTETAAMIERTNPASKKMLTLANNSFKIPTLRNIELTGPYMHNGGMATLEQVVEFYARGGNFESASKQFGLVFPQPELQLDPVAREDLINFLKSLTDERVRYAKAPFDHPEIVIPHGHQGDSQQVVPGNPLESSLGVDEFEIIPAVGADGNLNPHQSFDSYLQNNTQ